MKELLSNRLKAIIRFSDIVPILMVSLVLGAYALTLHDRTMPFTEGWYTYYAMCINEGLIPYKDFSYLFSPLYISTIAKFTEFFGYEIIKLRLLGVVFFVVIGIGVYLCSKMIFPKWISVISSITATLYLQTEPVQVFYDYIRLMDIFSVFTTFCLLLSVKGMILGRKCTYSLICTGILNSCFILVKQNMGLIYFAFVLIALVMTCLYANVERKQSIKFIALYLVGLLIPILITGCIMYYKGALGFFFNNTGSEALAAKGGLKAVLFNWWSFCFTEFLRAKNKTLFALMVLVISVFLSHLKQIDFIKDIKELRIRFWGSMPLYKDNKINIIIVLAFVICNLIILTIIKQDATIAQKIYFNKNISPYLIFIISTSIMIFLICVSIRKCYKKEKFINYRYFLSCILLGAYFSISYGCGTSGVLVEGQSTLGFSFCISLFLAYTNFNFWGRLTRGIIIILCLFVCIQSMDKKMLFTYNWWGVEESSYWEANYYTCVPMLRGIKVSKETMYVYDRIYEEITLNTDYNDKVLCFSHIPIFYSLVHRKDPGLYSKVQWFDVVSDKYLKRDMEVLERVKPKYILMYESGGYVYFMHEKLFRNGNVSGTRIMRNEIWEIISKDYKFVEEFNSHNNTINMFVRKDM